MKTVLKHLTKPTNRLFSKKDKHISFFDQQDSFRFTRTYNYFAKRFERYDTQVLKPDQPAYDPELDTGNKIYYSRKNNFYIDGIHPLEVARDERMFKELTDGRAFQRQIEVYSHPYLGQSYFRGRVFSELEEPKKTRNYVENPNEASEVFMEEQKRLDLNYSVNRQEHREYLKLYTEMKEIDTEQLEEKRKMIKYIKQNPDDPFSKQMKQRFNIVVPTEKLPDYDVDLTGYKLPTRKRKIKKPNADLTNYTAWRCFDRDHGFEGADGVVSKFKVSLAPADLIRAFGPPEAAIEDKSTGFYAFEDSNLDIFVVFDFKKTTQYHGYNYEEEEYKDQSYLQPKFRTQSWPSKEEFWQQKERTTFEVSYTNLADKHRFKKWIRQETTKWRKSEKSKEEELIAKFGEIDTFEDFKKERKNVPSENFAINYSPDYFLGKDEKTTLPREEMLNEAYVDPLGGEYFEYNVWQRHMKVVNREKKKLENKRTISDK